MCHLVPSRARGLGEALFVALALWAIRPAPADACGCLSPPIPPPMPDAVDFAVNQQAEQIIFEVEPDGQHIVAHVLIRYAGDPSQFAWIVPVPSVPELALSYADAFGLIDQQTSPQVTAYANNACPAPLYECRQHPMPICNSPPTAGTTGSPAFAPSSGAAGSGAIGPVPNAPGVTVFARQQIGSYDTVVFGAGDAQGAVAWLMSEGFIVNDTMSPYMQPYLDENMLFVAAKLIPGADADEIRPLRMRYEGSQPMIPLQLTAVATEPNLTVTAYIYGATSFEPQDQTLLTEAEIPEDALGGNAQRSNYPMVLSRLFDEEGGHAFMLEYAGAPPRFQPVPLNQNVGGFPGQIFPPGIATCCDASPQVGDPCGILNDGECQCPLSPDEAEDCGDQPDLVAGVKLVEDLATNYAVMTRLTTRLSADEMTFDPMFEPSETTLSAPRITNSVATHSLAGCEGDLRDRERYDELEPIIDCATTYCGRGTCIATAAGIGCACDPGQVARIFTDLDAQPSITCVPETAPVDLEAGGLTLPDICDTLSSLEASASCVNLAGFAGVRCDEGSGAVLMGSVVAPNCAPITADSGSSGARNYSLEYLDLRICAPAPPACDARFGWLEESRVAQRESVESCASSKPDPSWLEIPPMPTCQTMSSGLGSGVGGSGAAPTTGIRPTSTPPDRVIQEDTTQPRVTLANQGSDDGGCSATAGREHARWGALGVASLVCLALLRRRRPPRP